MITFDQVAWPKTARDIGIPDRIEFLTALSKVLGEIGDDSDGLGFY